MTLLTERNVLQEIRMMDLSRCNLLTIITLSELLNQKILKMIKIDWEHRDWEVLDEMLTLQARLATLGNFDNSYEEVHKTVKAELARRRVNTLKTGFF